MEKVIVTGVNGFVGDHLVNELKDQGFTVIGVGREQSPSERIGDKLDEYYTCDLSIYEQVQALPLNQARGVINLAGLAAVGPSFDDPEFYMRINTAVIDTVCRAALEQSARDTRIIAVSSGAVYSSDQAMPLTEESKLAPESSPYAASKIAMEDLSKNYRAQGLDTVVVRPFNHIGPGQLTGFILPDLYEKLKLIAGSSQTELLVGNITTRRDYTDVRDVVKAYVALIKSDSMESDTYNVCSGRSLSGEEILQQLLKVMNLDDITPIVDDKQFRPSDAQELFGDNSKLQRDTGWKPEYDINQTIEDFVTSKQ